MSDGLVSSIRYKALLGTPKSEERIVPSPFPGMDPYLEGYLWPDVHGALAHKIRQQLAPQIQPKYVARLEVSVIEDTNPEAESRGLAHHPPGTITYSIGAAALPRFRCHPGCIRRPERHL